MFKLLHHFNETGTVHGHAGNAIIQKVNQIGIAFFLCNFGEQFLLRVDLSRVNSAKCSKLINCYLSLFINNKGLPIDTAAPSACRETRFIVQSWTGFLAYNSQIRIM